MRTGLLWAVGVALLAYFSIGIYRAGLDERPPPPTNAQIVFHGGRASGQRVRFKSWSAQYDRIVSNADQTILELENVHDGTIYKAGKPYLHVRAAQMTVNTVTRDFNVSGPLRVENVGTPRRSFETTAATWSDLGQRLTLPQRIVIRSGADAPLVVGSLVIDVKSGDLVMHDVAGPMRMK